MNTSNIENDYHTKDVLLYVPAEQLTKAFPIDGNKSMYPKGLFSAIKCVQGLTKKLKIQTKVPMLNFIDANQLYKRGEGQNYIYLSVDGRIVMTYDALILIQYLSHYQFAPQLLDETSQIRKHIRMIDWFKNSQLTNDKSQQEDQTQPEQVQQTQVQPEQVQLVQTKPVQTKPKQVKAAKPAAQKGKTKQTQPMQIQPEQICHGQIQSEQNQLEQTWHGQIQPVQVQLEQTWPTKSAAKSTNAKTARKIKADQQLLLQQEGPKAVSENLKTESLTPNDDDEACSQEMIENVANLMANQQQQYNMDDEIVGFEML